MSDPQVSALGALILTGGKSSRMGRDKAGIDWGGKIAVERVAALARSAGAGVVLTVGARDFGIDNVVEPKPGEGPAAGIVAGGMALRDRGVARALVLACDAPTITLDDLLPLLRVPGPGAAFEGLHLPLVVDVGRLPVASAGWSVRRLIADCGLLLLTSPADAVARLRGANTPDELAQLRGALK